MKLDLLTLMWVLPAASLVLAAAVLATQWRARAHDGLAMWGWGLLLHGLSYPAFGLRMAGWTVASIVITNLLSAATIALHQQAVAQFQKDRVSTPRRAWLAAPVLVIGLAAVALARHDMERNVLAAVILALQSSWLTWQAWGPGLTTPRERGRWLLVVGSSTLTLMFALRLVWSLLGDWTPGEAVPANMQATSYLVVVLVLLLNTLGFLLMQREHSEASLSEEERRHRQLIEASSEGICVLDNGVMKLVNRRLCDMSGWSTQELLGRSFFTLVDEQDQARAQAIHRQRMAGQADDLRYEVRIRTADGQERWWEIGGVAIEWKGRPATLNFITDITRRHRDDELLQLAADVFRHAYEGILLTDAQGRIVDVNEAFCRITGYSREEALGCKPSMLRSGRHDRAFFEAMWQSIRERDVWQGEIWNRRKNGEEYAQSLSIRAVRDPQGAVRQYIGLLSDITPRKRAEAELQQHREHLQEMVQARTAELSVAKEAAEAASRTKTQFLANVSHELRTPLHGVLGFTELALAEAGSPRQKECLETSLRLARNLGRLIDDLLEVARIEANRLELAHEPLTLHRVMENIRVLQEPQARAKGLAWRIDIDEALAQMPLQGDERRLGQVLVNLVDNAIKFTASGSVSIRADLLRQTDTAATLRLEVSDTGIGIASRDQSRIFNAFEQLEGGASRHYEGTGLGLYIARMLVQAMGGQLTVRSQPGQGSTFAFTVKLPRAADQPPGETPSGAPPSTKASAEWRQGMTDLVQQLEAGDPAVATLLEALIAQADEPQRTRLSSLRAPVSAFDFDAALPLARSLAEGFEDTTAQASPSAD